jgi:type II secretory pathway pseudopilin PulG
MRVAARGMTLVEVMMAGGILLFGMAGIMSMFVTAVRFHKEAVDEDAAAETAALLFNTLRANFAAGKVETNYQGVSPNYPDYSYSVHTQPLGEQGEHKVEIRVSWLARGEERARVFCTVMYLRPPDPQPSLRLDPRGG